MQIDLSRNMSIQVNQQEQVSQEPIERQGEESRCQAEGGETLVENGPDTLSVEGDKAYRIYPLQGRAGIQARR